MADGAPDLSSDVANLCSDEEDSSSSDGAFLVLMFATIHVAVTSTPASSADNARDDEGINSSVACQTEERIVEDDGDDSRASSESSCIASSMAAAGALDSNAMEA